MSPKQVQDTFGTLLKVAFAETVAYRSEMIIWVLSATMPLVMLGLWDAAAADGPIAGYAQADFARYFTVNLVVRHLTSVWLVWDMNTMIRSGELSPWLLRPVSYLWWNFAEALGAWPMRLLVLIPMLLGLYFWRPEIAFMPSISILLASMLSIIIGITSQFLIQLCFGAIAFWADQSLGLYSAWSAVWMVLGGYLVPQALLPQWLQDISPYLPFRATLGAPVELILGQAPIGETLLYQTVWLVAVAGLARLLWTRGIKQYGAFGA